MDQNGSENQDDLNAEDLAASHEQNVTPLNAVPEEVIEIKIFGNKALRRIRDMGRGPGSGEDGDGDGMTDDGTRWERPATPRSLGRRQMRIWTQYADDLTARRKSRARSAIARYREKMNSAPMHYNKDDLLELLKNAENDPATQREIKRVAQFVFEHDFPSGHVSRVNSVSIFEADTDHPRLEVEGAIYEKGFDSDYESFDSEPGIKIGEFSRSILPAGNPAGFSSILAKPGVIHEFLEIEDIDSRGRGIGSAFIAASEAMYSEMDLELIKVTAGMTDGPTVWALDGFDWVTDIQRSSHLGRLRQAIAVARSNGMAAADDYGDIEDAINAALDEDFDDPERLRPIHIATMEDFKELSQLAGNPGWTGIRDVRNYARQAAIRDAQVKAERAREERINATLRTREEIEAVIDELRKSANTFDAATVARYQEIWRLDEDDEDYIEGEYPTNDQESQPDKFSEEELKLADALVALRNSTWAERVKNAFENESDEPPDEQAINNITAFYAEYLHGEYKKYNNLLRGLFDNLGSSWGGPIEDRLSSVLSANDSQENPTLSEIELERIRRTLAVLEYAALEPAARTVYRGTLLSGKDRVLDIAPGDIVTDDAFLSTTLNPSLATNLSRSHDFDPIFVDPLNAIRETDGNWSWRGNKLKVGEEATLWQIELPEGVKVSVGNWEENEYILPAGTGLKIVSIDRHRSDSPSYSKIAKPGDIPSFVRIVAEVVDLKEQMLENTKKSAINFEQQVIEVKTFSTKILRRIRDQGKGPGSGKDGDGDGLTDDGTQYERPAAPAVLAPEISERWSTAYNQALARRTNAAKERIARMRKSGRQYRKEKYLDQINRAAQTQDTAAARKLAEGIFNHSSIGKDGAYSSIVTAIDFDLDDDTLGMNGMQVGGNILNNRGVPVGSFSRTLIPNSTFVYGDGKSGVYHDLLQLEEYAHDKGIARDFLLESEIQYSLAGLETIGLTAALDSGPWIWARDNYDWLSSEDRESHLSAVLRIVNLMAQNNQMNRDLARAYRDVFRQALNEVFSDSERLRPVHLAYMPGFGRVQEAAKASGTPRYRFAWTGVRPVRPYRNMVMEEEE